MIRIFRHYIPKFLFVLGLVEGLILFASVYFGLAPPFAETDPGASLLVGDLWPKAAAFTLLFVMAMASVGLYMRDLPTELRGVSLRLTVAFSGATLVLLGTFAVFPR